MVAPASVVHASELSYVIRVRGARIRALMLCSAMCGSALTIAVVLAVLLVLDRGRL